MLVASLVSREQVLLLENDSTFKDRCALQFAEEYPQSLPVSFSRPDSVFYFIGFFFPC